MANESARAHIGPSFFYQKVAGIDDDLVDLIKYFQGEQGNIILQVFSLYWCSQ